MTLAFTALPPRRSAFTGMAAVIVILHLAGWGLLIAATLSGDADALGLGIGVTAYTLGMRHAFDADHIAAIDNVTRRLTASSRHRPISAGFFFSLGHSSVVFALAAVLAFGLGNAVPTMLAEGSGLRQATAILGPTVSGTFLLVVAAMNIRSVHSLLLQRKGSRPDESRARPAPGLVTRILRRPLARVGRARHMYPIGFLFGLGFDTATEIGLLVIAAGSVASGAPWYGVLCLPLLFAAGMVLFDTLDGVFVGYAYGWALSGDARKVRYNVIVTAVSAIAALLIAAVEIIGAISEGLGWSGPVSTALASVDLNVAGIVLVAALTVLFLVVHFLRRTGRGVRGLQSIDASPADPT